MRKVDSKIDEIIDLITKLKGKSVDLEISRGRKKVEKISGIVDSIYPSIFTIKTQERNNPFSCSYADVLCGDVKLASKDIVDGA